jgi:hypothetical protein
VTAADRFNLNFERDRLFWVLEKLELAASHVEADNAPILWRLERALLESSCPRPSSGSTSCKRGITVTIALSTR